MKNIKGRTTRQLEERIPARLQGTRPPERALLPENGILRNLHFLQHNEIEDVLKTVVEKMSSSAKDDEDEDEDDVYE